MNKALDYYINDPDITDEPSALREIHAIRLKIHDECKGMTPEEFNSVVRQNAAKFLAPDNAREAAMP